VVLRFQSPEVEERWFVAYISGLILFLILWVICFRYKKPYAVRAMQRKKPISHNNHPLHLFMGIIKHHETMEKAPIP